MNEIKMTITDNAIDKLTADIYLDVYDLLNEMKMQDIVDYVLEYEDHYVLLERIGIDACKDHFDLKD